MICIPSWFRLSQVCLVPSLPGVSGTVSPGWVWFHPSWVGLAPSRSLTTRTFNFLFCKFSMISILQGGSEELSSCR